MKHPDSLPLECFTLVCLQLHSSIGTFLNLGFDFFVYLYSGAYK